MPDDWLCDGEVDCEGGQDERDCGEYLSYTSIHVAVYSMYLSTSDWLCDDDVDSEGAQEERDSGEYLSYKYSCSSILSVISIYLSVSDGVCDGEVNSEGIQDEHDCGISFKNVNLNSIKLCST